MKIYMDLESLIYLLLDAYILIFKLSLIDGIYDI